jgi:hypothetical protein
MEVIKNILKDLEIVSELNHNEWVGEDKIYDFIIANCGYNQITENLNYFFIKLSAAAISVELYRQEDFGDPSFQEDDIIQLLHDREEKEYHQLYEYYFDKQEFLEYHNINGETYFFGKDLKIKYDVLIKMIATVITSDLNRVLEKLKRHLYDNVELVSWLELITGVIDDDDIQLEKEIMDHTIKGVLGN